MIPHISKHQQKWSLIHQKYYVRYSTLIVAMAFCPVERWSYDHTGLAIVQWRHQQKVNQCIWWRYSWMTSLNNSKTGVVVAPSLDRTERHWDKMGVPWPSMLIFLCNLIFGSNIFISLSLSLRHYHLYLLAKINL